MGKVVNGGGEIVNGARSKRAADPPLITKTVNNHLSLSLSLLYVIELVVVLTTEVVV